MRVSTRGRYGLRIMTDLAARHGDGPVTAATLARNQAISSRYVHNLLPALRTAGLIRVVRGPAGGVVLARPPRTISALDVVRALEATLAPVDCVEQPAACPRAGACTTRDLWSEVAAAVAGVLGGATLDVLAARQRARAATGDARA